MLVKGPRRYRGDMVDRHRAPRRAQPRRRPDDAPVGPVPIRTGTAELRPEGPGQVTLLVNGVPSSFVDHADPTWLEFEYMQQMAAFVEHVTQGPLRAVHLGAGGCTMARWLDHTRPGSTQLAVEVDPVLATLVRSWFDLPRSPALRIRVGDARDELASLPDTSADLVIRDVFAPDVTPPRLRTVEFARDVARVLRPGGLYLANCADRPPLRLARSEVATFYAVFADVALVAEPGQFTGRRHGNLVLAAIHAPGSPFPLDSPGLARDLRSLPVPARLRHGADLAGYVAGAPTLRDE